jgi:hypothetical protein
MANYKQEFFDKLLHNIRNLEGKLTASTDGSLTRSIENTCYWCRALQLTFNDMGDIAGMMGMIASCDYSPIQNKKE